MAHQNEPNKVFTLVNVKQKHVLLLLNVQLSSFSLSLSLSLSLTNWHWYFCKFFPNAVLHYGPEVNPSVRTWCYRLTSILKSWFDILFKHNRGRL